MLAGTPVIDFIKDYVQYCKSLNINFDRVILFGSYAHGTPHPDSDIDVALVSSLFSNNGFENRKRISKANIRFTPIEPHTFSTAYFEKGDPFIEEIKRTGIEVAI